MYVHSKTPWAIIVKISSSNNPIRFFFSVPLVKKITKPVRNIVWIQLEIFKEIFMRIVTTVLHRWKVIFQAFFTFRIPKIYIYMLCRKIRRGINPSCIVIHNNFKQGKRKLISKVFWHPTVINLNTSYFIAMTVISFIY